MPTIVGMCERCDMPILESDRTAMMIESGWLCGVCTETKRRDSDRRFCHDCGHEHTGVEWAYICIGCPCPHVPNMNTVEEILCGEDGEPWPCPIFEGSDPFHA